MLSNLLVSLETGRAMRSSPSAAARGRVSDAGQFSGPVNSLIINGSRVAFCGNSHLRFSETEAVAIISLLVSRYKIEVKDEPQFAGETFEQRKERLLRFGASITV